MTVTNLWLHTKLINQTFTNSLGKCSHYDPKPWALCIENYRTTIVFDYFIMLVKITYHWLTRFMESVVLLKDNNPCYGGVILRHDMCAHVEAAAARVALFTHNCLSCVCSKDFKVIFTRWPVRAKNSLFFLSLSQTVKSFVNSQQW